MNIPDTIRVVINPARQRIEVYDAGPAGSEQPLATSSTHIHDDGLGDVSVQVIYRPHVSVIYPADRVTFSAAPVAVAAAS